MLKNLSCLDPTHPTAHAPSTASLDSAGCYVVGNSVMAPPSPGTFGTIGRNMVRDSGFKNRDLPIFENFTVKGQLYFQFRAEFESPRFCQSVRGQ
jgi:hypothetical protein